jgi:3-oxoacyl-[acyl-carrier-protein] synthase III
MTNADFERILDTSDEWIVQRTGIRERRISRESGESCLGLARSALDQALSATELSARDLDLVIVATSTADMSCPPVASRVAAQLGASRAATFDLGAACSGFLYGLSLAESMLRVGRAQHVAVIGSEAMSSAVDYTERTGAVLFGDAAGCAILAADQDPSRGMLYQELGADGGDWNAIYIPRAPQDIPPEDRDHPARLGCIRIRGQQVYRFAVSKTCELIQRALERTGLAPSDLGQVICHQSNLRILEAVRTRMELDPERFYVNIERFGNTGAGSLPLCLDALWRAGRLPPGKPILMVAVGGGLTWASCVFSP